MMPEEVDEGEGEVMNVFQCLFKCLTLKWNMDWNVFAEQRSRNF